MSSSYTYEKRRTVTIRGDWRLNVAAFSFLAILRAVSTSSSSFGGGLCWSLGAFGCALIAVRLAMARIVLSSEGVRMCGPAPGSTAGDGPGPNGARLTLVLCWFTLPMGHVCERLATVDGLVDSPA